MVKMNQRNNKNERAELSTYYLKSQFSSKNFYGYKNNDLIIRDSDILRKNKWEKYFSQRFLLN